MKSTEKQNHIYWFLATFYILWSIRVFVLWPWTSSINATPETKQIIGDALRIFLWLGPLAVYLRWQKQKDVLNYLRISSSVNVKWLWVMTAICLTYLEVLLFTGSYVFEKEMNLFVQIGMKIMLTPIVEEILFRGFVLRMFEQQYRAYFANILQAVFFGAAHFFWLYQYGFTWDVAGMFVSAMTIGWFLGFMAQRTDSILPSIVYHIANNILGIYRV
jgi:membrane protease YdiL (CAAX protease family)